MGMRQTVEDLVAEIQELPLKDYLQYHWKGRRAFDHNDGLFEKSRFNPFPGLHPLFLHIIQGDYDNTDGQGTSGNLTDMDVYAMYGRLYELFDATTGCMATLKIFPRFFNEEARIKRRLPKIKDIVSYLDGFS